jgi:hypothetical protein
LHDISGRFTQDQHDAALHSHPLATELPSLMSQAMSVQSATSAALAQLQDPEGRLGKPLSPRMTAVQAMRLDSLVQRRPCGMLHALVDCLKARLGGLTTSCDPCNLELKHADRHTAFLNVFFVRCKPLCFNRPSFLFQADPRMLMHVALEYAVPHLGLVSQLQYGGLGKVVETFIVHNTRPMLVSQPVVNSKGMAPAVVNWMSWIMLAGSSRQSWPR